MKKLFYIGVITLLVTSCVDNATSEENAEGMNAAHESHHDKGHHGHGHGEANEYMHSSEFNELVKRFESKERDGYQEPDKVIEFLGDIKGQTIMDLGAGTGYFSFRFENAGAIVIAADVNQQFQNYIQKKKDSLKISDDKLRLRKIEYDDPLLGSNEVDKVVIVNTYHHIENRVAYFSKVKNGLKKGGELVVIDFMKKEMPFGPPVKMKLTADEVSKELKEAGFAEVQINDDLLKYQYIIRAK